MKRALALTAALLLLGGAAFLVQRQGRGRRAHAPSTEEIRALTAERDRLRDGLRVRLDQDDVLDFAHAPRGNVIVGVPTRLAENLVQQMVSGIFSEVRLHLGGLRAHHHGDVKVKVFRFTRHVGHYNLDVDIVDVRAALHPKTPTLEFGGNVIGIRLPVAVDRGQGSGNVRFRWAGKGLAGAVCGDADVTTGIASAVRPATYTVEGRFVLSAEGDTLLATPRFRDLRLRVFLQPSEQTWATLAAAVEGVKKDKNRVCRAAIQKVNVKALVRKAIAPGFGVRVPATLIPPLSLPATVEHSVDVQGRSVSLNARTLGLVVSPVMLWYGVDVSVPR